MIKSIRYILLIEKAKRREKKNPLTKDFEKHHIIPKCCGGTNKKENMVKLTYREHFIAHRELALSNPDNDKLQMAYGMMCVGRDECSAEEYEEARAAWKLGLGNDMKKGEHSKRISESLKGKKKTEEHKRNLSKANMGKTNSEEARRKISIASKASWASTPDRKNGFEGKKHSKESKEKISKALKGRKTPSQFKSVINTTTGDVYESIAEASRQTGIFSQNIGRNCKNETKTAGGYVWKYYNDYVEEIKDEEFL